MIVPLLMRIYTLLPIFSIIIIFCILHFEKKNVRQLKKISKNYNSNKFESNIYFEVLKTDI